MNSPIILFQFYRLVIVGVLRIGIGHVVSWTSSGVQCKSVIVTLP